MYEGFGALVQEPAVTFRLFFPDNQVDPAQYARGGTPGIRSVRVTGDFQSKIGGTDWDPASALAMQRDPHPHGWLYSFRIRQRWWRTQPLAMALLTTCGAVMIHNGQEFGEPYWFPEEGEGRVMPRPVRWGGASEPGGRRLFDLYRRLIAIRKAHPGLRTRNFHPDRYDERLLHFDPDGYGVSVDQDVAIYHRWGTGTDGRLERFIIVLNFSDYGQTVTIPFSENGAWEDVLNGGTAHVQHYRLENQGISSNWGRTYLRRG